MLVQALCRNAPLMHEADALRMCRRLRESFTPAPLQPRELPSTLMLMLGEAQAVFVAAESYMLAHPMVGLEWAQPVLRQPASHTSL